MVEVKPRPESRPAPSTLLVNVRWLARPSGRILRTVRRAGPGVRGVLQPDLDGPR